MLPTRTGYSLCFTRAQSSGISPTPLSLVSSVSLCGLQSVPPPRPLMKMMNRTIPVPLGYSASYWPSATPSFANHRPLGLATQLIFNLPRCLLTQPIYQQLVYENLVRDGAKGLSEVWVSLMNSLLSSIRTAISLCMFIKSSPISPWWIRVNISWWFFGIHVPGNDFQG